MKYLLPHNAEEFHAIAAERKELQEEGDREAAVFDARLAAAGPVGSSDREKFLEESMRLILARMAKDSQLAAKQDALLTDLEDFDEALEEWRQWKQGKGNPPQGSLPDVSSEG
jgi:hypothetical protein